MSAPQEQDIALDLIDLGKRLRDVDQDKAAALALSMRERGLLSPIELREAPAGRYKLNTGAHRFVGAQMLEWQKIRAIIVVCSDDEARLREIDENLFRNELSPFDQANFLEERRQIWERVHGAIKRGGDRRSKAQIEPLIDGIGRGGTFIKETAAKFGLPPTMVKRALTRKAQIAPKVWEVLRTTDAARNGSLLDKIRKLELEEQFAVAETIQERGCTVQQAVKIVSAPAEIDVDIRDYDALRLVWKRASPAARQQFLDFVEASK